MKPANKSSSLASEENDNLVKALEVGSLCALGGGLPLPVKNVPKYFEGELGGYFR